MKLGLRSLRIPVVLAFSLASLAGCSSNTATATPPEGNDGGTTSGQKDGSVTAPGKDGSTTTKPPPVQGDDAGPPPVTNDAGNGNGNGDDTGTVVVPPTGDCTSPNLTWKSANKTNFTSYPDPGSPECVQFNGCQYEGQFAACTNTEPLSWVQSHNIVAVFPNFTTVSNGIGPLSLHDLCLRDPNDPTHTILVTALDECADSDCSGCCTQNKGNADQLIDVESFTDARWGVQDGPIEWADMGPTTGSGCN